MAWTKRRVGDEGAQKGERSVQALGCLRLIGLSRHFGTQEPA